MLRTNFEPDVKEWVARGHELADRKLHRDASTLSEHDRNELWEWAPSAANAEARRQKWGADYTLAEKEMGIDRVVTGLRRELVVPPDEDMGEDEEYEEDDEDDGEGAGDQMDLVEVPPKPDEVQTDAGARAAASAAPMPLAVIQRFMTTGKIGT